MPSRHVDPIDIIDRFLMSGRSPENAMGLSDLDGFLTGIVIGPEMIMPSEWLPVVWAHDTPRFRDNLEAQLVMTAIMDRYNEIVRGFQKRPPEFDPVLWETKDGLTVAADWADGFNDAIELRLNAWKPLIEDREHSALLRPIQVLCDDSDPDEETELMEKATKYLADSIIGIYHYWRKFRR